MKKYFYSSFIFLFALVPTVALGATSYYISNTSVLNKTLTLSWTAGNFVTGSTASIVLEGPTSCNENADGSIGICTFDIRRTVLATIPASNGSYDLYLDGSNPRTMLGKQIYVEVSGSRVDFNASPKGETSVSSGTRIDTGTTVTTGSTETRATILPFTVSVSPSVVNAGGAVSISWSGTYQTGTHASITYERPSSCSRSQTGSLLCTMDLRSVPVATLEASAGTYRWTTEASTRPVAGAVSVTIGTEKAVAGLQINETGSTNTSNTTTGSFNTTSNVTSSVSETTVPSGAFNFEAVCKKSAGVNGNTAQFSVTYYGGTSPFSYVWFDNGKELASLQAANTPGYHKIAILATDSKGYKSWAECGDVTLAGASAPEVNVTINAPTSSCVDLSANLRRGVRSVDVVKMQTYLKSQKIFDEETTGYFGAVTEASVRSFQAVNSIEATGFVGPLTRAKLKALSCAQ
jgi:peptidoglycan hydrolase-like protein with peptidoglycan-binding domain